MNTIKLNKLISEFMEYKNITPEDKDFNIYEDSKGNTFELMSMEFHKSWDWLMPVIEKIESQGFRFNIWKNNYCIEEWTKETEYHNPIFYNYSYSKKTKIESIYLGVIDVIRYINAKKL